MDEKNIDNVFKVSLYIKAIDGLFECLGGILFLFLKSDQLNSLARLLTQHELSTDPHDFIANHILKSAHDLTSASLIFGALYLLSHGILKIILVIEVLRRHLWAYIGLLIVTVGFVFYQVYRLSIRLTFSMIVLTLFDLLVIYLTQKDYKKQKQIISNQS